MREIKLQELKSQKPAEMVPFIVEETARYKRVIESA